MTITSLCAFILYNEFFLFYLKCGCIYSQWYISSTPFLCRNQKCGPAPAQIMVTNFVVKILPRNFAILSGTVCNYVNTVCNSICT